MSYLTTLAQRSETRWQNLSVKGLLQRCSCTANTTLVFPAGVVHVRSNSVPIIDAVRERYFPFASAGKASDGSANPVLPNERVVSIYDEAEGAPSAHRWKSQDTHLTWIARRGAVVRRAIRKRAALRSDHDPGSMRFVGSSHPGFVGDLEVELAVSRTAVDASSQRKLDAATNAPFWTQTRLFDGELLQKHRFRPGAFEHFAVARGASHAQVPPHESDPFHVVSDDGGDWVLFGKGASDAKNVDSIIELAWVSSNLYTKGGVWIRGDVIASKETGKSVLLIGPKQLGKTTLALHAASMIKGAHLVSADSLNLYQAAGSGSNLSAAGFPSSLMLGPGSIMGTMLENTRLKEVFPDVAQDETLRSFRDEGGLWRMQKSHLARLSDVTNAVDPFAPNVSAIVYVNWNPPADASLEPKAFAREVPGGEINRVLQQAAEQSCKSHRLLRSITRSDYHSRAEQEFVKLLENAVAPSRSDRTHSAAQLYELAGHVAFGPGVRFLASLLQK